MRQIAVVAALMLFVAGCSGTGFDKSATLMPDSVSMGYMREQYKGDRHAWSGISVSATWEFK